MNTAAVTETYEDVEQLIYKTIHNYQKRHGGEWDDLLGECHEAFIDAYQYWQQEVGVLFSTYLRHVLWRRMSKATHESRKMIYPSVPIGDFDIPDPRPDKQHWLSELMEEISEDARLAVALALDLPAELADVAERRGGSGANIRTTIIDALCSDGWPRRSAMGIMREIRAALSEVGG